MAQAASTTTPVQQIVKSLNELTTKAIQRVYRDQRKGLFPDPRADQFARAGGQARAARAMRAYLFNGALARHLKDAKGWDEKVLTLLADHGEGARRGRRPAQADSVVDRRDHGGNPQRLGGAA